MEIRPLSTTFSVAGQIAPPDLAKVRALGFRTVICNRPDGEAPDQPGFAVIRAAAEAAGLAALYLPIVPGQMTGADVAALSAALDAHPGPHLGYCRSGARAAALWDAATSRSAA